MADLQSDLAKLRAETEREIRKLATASEEHCKSLSQSLEEKIKALSEQLNRKVSENSTNEVREFIMSSNNLALSSHFDMSKENSKNSEEGIAKPLFRSPLKD